MFDNGDPPHSFGGYRGRVRHNPKLAEHSAALGKRIDETADMTALSPQIYEYPTVQIRSGSRMVQRTPAAPESSSRDSPGVERTPSKAQRFQIWVMRVISVETQRYSALPNTRRQ